jgi:hypothetical protein
MKKALVLLLILAFTGVVTYAQDAAAPAAAPAPKLSLSGRVETGLLLSGGTTGNPTLQLKDSKDSGNALDSQINAAYGDGATWGLNLGLGFSNSTAVTATSTYVGGATPTVTTAIGSLYLDDTNVWFKPIPQLKLTLGKSSFGDFGVQANGNGSFEPDTTSFRLDILPIDGLLITGYLPVAVTPGDIVNNFADLAFGAKFALPKVFNVELEYFLQSSDNVGNFTGAKAADTVTAGNAGQLVASAGLDAVDNLTVQASVSAILGTGYTTVIYEFVAYNFGIVKPQVWAVETLTSVGTAIELNPKLSFTLVKDIFNPGLGFDYKIPADGSTSTWGLELDNTFTVGNNGIQVQVDINGGATTTWDVKVSYDLTWSN